MDGEEVRRDRGRGCQDGFVSILSWFLAAWFVFSAFVGTLMVIPKVVVDFLRKTALGTPDVFDDDELHKLEREALDSTVRWAYTRGYVDALNGIALSPEGQTFVVQDFRLQWGEDRRETVG